MNIVSQRCIILSLLCLATASSRAEVDLSKLPPPSTKTGVTFAQDIKPLLEASCVKCHSGDKPKAGLDTLENTLKGSKEGKVLVSGKSQQSQIVIAMAQLDPESAMPPKPRQGRRGPGGPGGPPAGGPPPGAPGAGGPPPGQHGGFGPPPKPLTPAEVGLVRAWIDQGAK